MLQQSLEEVADVEIQRVPLVVVDVAAGDRGEIEMPHETFLVERQRPETVRVDLHDGSVIDALEEVPAALGHSNTILPDVIGSCTEFGKDGDRGRTSAAARR